jgi:hypothetical protein
VQDGQRCSIPVNASKCAFCEYHVAAQYKKLQMKVGAQFLDNNIGTAYRSLTSGG